MVWQNISPVGYAHKKAYYRLLVCFLQKSGLKMSLKKTEYHDAEGFLEKMQGTFIKYDRFSIDGTSYGSEDLNYAGYVTYDCKDFFQACINWIDFEKMTLLDAEESDERIEEYNPFYLEDMYLGESEEEEYNRQLKEIAKCIIAIYQKDKKLVEQYKEEFLFNQYISIYTYVDTLIKDLGKVVGVKEKDACTLMPYLISSFSFPLNGMEQTCIYNYRTAEGEEGTLSSDTCRILQVFHLKDVRKLKKLLTEEEMEELLHPVNCFDEKFRKVFSIGKNDMYIVYTSLALDLDTVPVSFSNVNPAAVAVGLKLNQQA